MEEDVRQGTWFHILEKRITFTTNVWVIGDTPLNIEHAVWFGFTPLHICSHYCFPLFFCSAKTKEVRFGFGVHVNSTTRRLLPREWILPKPPQLRWWTDDDRLDNWSLTRWQRSLRSEGPKDYTCLGCSYACDVLGDSFGSLQSLMAVAMGVFRLGHPFELCEWIATHETAS